MVVHGTNRSQIIFEKFFGPKKEIWFQDKLPKKSFFDFFHEFLGLFVPYYKNPKN
jgi:hypothetical protein